MIKRSKKTHAFGLFESVIAIGIVGLFIVLFGSSFTFISFEQYIRDRARAMELAQQEVEAIRNSSFSKLSTWTDTHFLGVAFNKGLWAVQNSGSAVSSPNVYTLGKPSPVASGVTGIAIVPGGDYTNFTFETSIKALADSQAGFGTGVVFRYIDHRNYYKAWFTASTLVFSKVVDGVEAVLYTENPRTFNTDQWYKLKVVTNGSSIELWVDDVQRTTQVDLSFAKGKLALLGLDSAHPQFDNVTVTTTSSTTWNLDADTVNIVANGWERFGIQDLPGGNDVLIVQDAVGGFTDLKKVTARVEWQQRSQTRSIELITYVHEHNVQ